MLAIRLTRIGAKKQPSYRIIVSEKRYKRDGRYIDKLGFYNPLTNPATISVDKKKFDYWMKVGAQPTPVIKRIVMGIKGAKKRAAKKTKEASEGEASPKAKQAYAPTATEVKVQEEAAGAGTAKETAEKETPTPKAAPDEAKEAPKEETRAA